MILFSRLWLPRGFSKFPKKPNLLIEVFPFRGLLVGMGSIASKSLDRHLQCGRGTGHAKVEPHETAGGRLRMGWSPKEKLKATKDFR
jgi:hypothetical protein